MWFQVIFFTSGLQLASEGGGSRWLFQSILALQYISLFLFFASGLKAALRSRGPLCILEHFDTSYSVLQWVQHCTFYFNWSLLLKIFRLKPPGVNVHDLNFRNFRTVDAALKEDTLELLIQGRCPWWRLSDEYCDESLHLPWFIFSSCVFIVVQGLSVSLPPLLLSGSLSVPDRKEQLNAVKMSVFLLCKLTEYLESDSYRESVVTAPSKVLYVLSF